MSEQEETLLALMQEVYTQGTEQNVCLTELLDVISEKLIPVIKPK